MFYAKPFIDYKQEELVSITLHKEDIDNKTIDITVQNKRFDVTFESEFEFKSFLTYYNKYKD